MSRIATLWVSQPIEIRSTPDRWRGGRRDAAGGFGHCAARDHRDRLREHVRIHVVKQHGVNAMIERLAQLIERIDFELDLDQMANTAFRPL